MDTSTDNSVSRSTTAGAVLAPVIEFLVRHAPFDRMAGTHLEFLAQRAQLAFYARGETITDPGQGMAERFFIIKQGLVRGEVEPGGDHDAWELHPGECFPIGALLAPRPVHMAQRAAEDTFCYELTRDDFSWLYAESPEFRDFCSRRLASMLDRTLTTLQATIAARISGDAPANAALSSLLGALRLPARPVRHYAMRWQPCMPNMWVPWWLWMRRAGHKAFSPCMISWRGPLKSNFRLMPRSSRSCLPR